MKEVFKNSNIILARRKPQNVEPQRRGVVAITTARLHSTKPKLRFCAGSNPVRGVSNIIDGEDLWKWPRLEIRLKAFLRSTIPQK